MKHPAENKNKNKLEAHVNSLIEEQLHNMDISYISPQRMGKIREIIIQRIPIEYIELGGIIMRIELLALIAYASKLTYDLCTILWRI